MSNELVDPFRFIDFATRNVIRAWMRREQVGEIPWTAPKKPLSELRVAIVSTAGVVEKRDRPFDIEGEKRNPWWGDPSYRIIDIDCQTRDVDVQHTHINTRFPEQDFNCVFPLDRLKQAAAQGLIGDVAPRHYSIMGYQLDTTELMRDSAPRIADHLRSDEVDLALLIPV